MENPPKMWDTIKESNMCVMGISEAERKRSIKIFEEIIAEKPKQDTQSRKRSTW